MKPYELNCLISPEISGEELNSLREKFNSLIQGWGGIFEEIISPTRKRLSYPIEKQGEVLFLGARLHLPEEKIGELEKELKAEKKILRYLFLFKKPQKKISAARIRRPFRRFISKAAFPKEKKVELKEINKKLEEILGEENELK